MLQINSEMFAQIMERFDRIERALERMNKLKECLDGDTLLDNDDLCRLLGITKRTLARYRQKKLVTYYMIDGRTYYKASEVEADNPLGSGPYTFHATGDTATMNKVPNWWAGVDVPVRVNTIQVIPAQEPAQIRDEFEFSDVSLVMANPMADSFAEFRCDYELWEIESGYMIYLGCNIL